MFSSIAHLSFNNQFVHKWHSLSSTASGLKDAKIELEITDKQMVESKIALANAILLHKREDKKVKVLEERIRKAKAAAKREAQEEEDQEQE